MQLNEDRTGRDIENTWCILISSLPDKASRMLVESRGLLEA